MSIIADALKKAEVSPEHSPRPYGLYMGILVVCVGLVLAGITQVTRRPVSPAVRTAAPAAQPVPAAAPEKPSAEALPASSETQGIQLFQAAQAGLVLNGTILDSNGKSLALINNQVLREGDPIGSMRVVKVDTDSVELQDQDGKAKTLGLKN